MSSRLLIPFAAASAPDCQALLPTLSLPALRALLALLQEQSPGDRGEEDSLSPPHERALAQAMGLPVADGRIAWAAARSATPTTPQAWFSLCHYQIGMDQVNLLPGSQLALEDAESQALFDAFAPLCAQDGISLRRESATEWRASGEPLRDIACASLDRVGGRGVGPWLAESPDNPDGARLLRRLQSEAQMLFYTHPVHDARSARGLLPVNGFWVHGAGALSTADPLAPAPTVPQTLRLAALRSDWSAWQAAWQALDQCELSALLAAARRGEPVTLTLCGERHARTWVSTPRGTLARLGHTIKTLVGTPPPGQTLKDL